MGEFGDRFRKAREKKEFSFDDVSNVIKISPRMLRAIEEEDFDRLPGGVVNKRIIRPYAKHLGLDSEEAVNDYLASVRQAQIEAQQAWQPEHPVETPSAAPGKNKAANRNKPAANQQSPVQVEELPDLQLPRAEDVRPPRRAFALKSSPDIPWRLIAVAAVVVVLGIVLWTRHSRNLRTESAKPTAPTANAPVAPTAPPLATPATPPQSSTPRLQPPQPASIAQATAPVDEDKNDVSVRNFGKPAPKVAENASGSLTLVVRATETSWISVIADGQPATEETLIAPAHTTFRASNELVVKVGNAAGVSFLFNGTEIAPQGNESEVKTLTFDGSGLKTVVPRPTPSTPN